MHNINDLKDFNTYERTYFNNFISLYKCIEKSNGYKIIKLNSDIKFIIYRMKKCLDKIKIILNQFEKDHNESLMYELTEITYLYVSYAYSIQCINSEVLNKIYPIKKFEKKREKIFNDSSHMLVIHVIRNSYHHGQFLFAEWNCVIKEKESKLYLTFNMDEINNLTDKDGNKRLKKNNISELNNNDGRINLIELFSRYLIQVEEFYEWYKNERNNVYNEEVELFNILMNNHKKLLKKNNWNNNRFSKLNT